MLALPAPCHVATGMITRTSTYVENKSIGKTRNRYAPKSLNAFARLYSPICNCVF